MIVLDKVFLYVEGKRFTKKSRYLINPKFLAKKIENIFKSLTGFDLQEFRTIREDFFTPGFCRFSIEF